MSTTGTRKARIILILAAYATAGLVSTLGIAWFGQLLDREVTEAAWIVPPVEATDEVPADARIVVHRASSWCGVSYRHQVWYLPWADAAPPRRPKNAAVIAGQLGSLPIKSEGWGIWPLKGAIPSCSVIADHRGFPFLCVWSWTDGAQKTRVRGPRSNSYFDTAADVGLPPDPKWRLSVTPHWPGLIANTIIWGLAWFAALFLPLHLRPFVRASRTRRKLCTACAYDLTGAKGRCPECGMRVGIATVMGRVLYFPAPRQWPSRTAV